MSIDEPLLGWRTGWRRVSSSRLCLGHKSAGWEQSCKPSRPPSRIVRMATRPVERFIGMSQILTVSIISTYVLAGTQFVFSLLRTRIQHYSRYCASNYAILKEWSEERLVELLLKLFTLTSKKGNWLQIVGHMLTIQNLILDVCNGLDKPSLRQAEVSGETYHMLGALSMKMPLGCTLKSSHFCQ